MKACKKPLRPQRSAIAAVLVAGLAGPALAAPGDPLGPVFNVADAPYEFGYRQAAIARDADGDIAVVWRSNGGVYARLLHADGTPKGPQFVVTSMPAVGLPDVAMDADGDFVVGWSRLDAAAPGIYAQRYHADGSADGATLQVSEPFDAAPGQTALESPAVAMDADGDFIVAWGQGRYLERGNWYACGYGIGLCARVGGYSVRVRRYTQGGTQAQAAQLADAIGAGEVVLLGIPLGLGSTEDRVSAAMAPDGRFVVAWNRMAEGLSLLPGVYARRYDRDGRAEGKRLVSLQRDQAMPSVAIDANGAYVVAYRRGSRALNDYTSGVYTRRYPAGLGLGSFEARVDDGGADSAYAVWPSVAMDNAGDYVVSWPAGTSIYAQRYASGGGALGANVAVATSDALGAVRFPDVAMDADGDFAIVWDRATVEYEPGNPEAIYRSGIDARLYDGP
jgi:hypothetical protein